MHMYTSSMVELHICEFSHTLCCNDADISIVHVHVCVYTRKISIFQNLKRFRDGHAKIKTTATRCRHGRMQVWYKVVGVKSRVLIQVSHSSQAGVLPKSSKTQHKAASAANQVPCCICLQTFGPKAEVLFCLLGELHLHHYCTSVIEQKYQSGEYPSQSFSVVSNLDRKVSMVL